MLFNLYTCALLNSFIRTRGECAEETHIVVAVKHDVGQRPRVLGCTDTQTLVRTAECIRRVLDGRCHCSNKKETVENLVMSREWKFYFKSRTFRRCRDNNLKKIVTCLRSIEWLVLPCREGKVESKRKIFLIETDRYRYNLIHLGSLGLSTYKKVST